MIPARALVYVDGRLVAASKARVSAFDHGFLYGDSVYETLRTEAGRPVFLAAHLRRLARSARLLHLDLPDDVARIAAVVRAARRRLGNGEVALRIMVTRGPGALYPDPALAGPTRLLVFATPFSPRPEFHYLRGVSARLARARKASPRSIPARAKTGNFLPHVLAIHEARRGGGDEALMLSSDGYLAEGATSNLFWFKGATLFTPHARTGILPGITRGVLLRLARRDGQRVREVLARPAVLRRADEAFLTNSTGGVVPLTRLDGRPIGTGRVGPRTRRLAELYAAASRKS